MGIDISNVSFKYIKKNGVYELKDINLSISERGEFVTILGHTGSGKSTLVQLMNGLLLPDIGTIKVFDHTLTPKYSGKLKDVRHKVGLVFQFPEYQLFEETVLKDVMFGPRNFGESKEEAEKSARHACELVGISSDLLSRPPFNLSGGQMRKVAIAGILALKPEILVLDEPTVGLDPQSKKDLLNLLVQIQKETQKTIIVITHDMDLVAKYSKRVIVLKDESIVYDGSKEALFSNITKLKEFNLDLPNAAKIALKLREKGLVNFQKIPLSIAELFENIKGDNHE